jgi:glycolate dehydrogenase FAD-linked subunit
VALPATASETTEVVAWCYAHDVPLIPRGGGSGYSGGAVPLDGGVVLCLQRLTAPLQITPARWRAHAGAGVRTADLRRRAREEGLMFGPDPGAGEQSMIGGNIATNAGGPHAFKYGATGAWVTGVEVVVAPGELVSFGGVNRKDVGGYDLKSLIVGSEGTLGVITSAWLRLLPAPEASLPVLALYPSAEAGCAGVDAVFAAGLVPAALEFFDAGALEASLRSLTDAFQTLPPSAADNTRFMVIAEADGSAEEASQLRRELRGALAPGAVGVHAPTAPREIGHLWRWREGVSLAVTARRGGKLSEDIVVPVERLGEAIAAVLEIGSRHELEACSWGHAGDGNLHATFLLDPDDGAERERAQEAAGELFELAASLGGAVSGEHGIGLVKRGALARQWSAGAVELHERIKQTLDPKGLFNPGKKLPR